MAATTTILTSPYFSFNSVDLTAQVQKVEFNFSLDELEKTASGDTSHLFVPGLEKPTCSVTFYKNYGAGSVDATLWAAKGTAVTVIVAPAGSTEGASNPKYTFTAFASGFPLISGQVGQMEMCTVNLSMGSTISRDVTP
jgi:hypothetical protein